MLKRLIRKILQLFKRKTIDTAPLAKQSPEKLPTDIKLEVAKHADVLKGRGVSVNDGVEPENVKD